MSRVEIRDGWGTRLYPAGPDRTPDDGGDGPGPTELARPGDLQPDATRPRRPPLHDLQDPEHVQRLRATNRASVVDPGRPAVTPIGRILRATHIDELPQLWNIIRGEMTLVGPRPERPEIAAELEKVLPCYGDRLLARPGVTGLAQVKLPPDTDIESVRRKLALDLYYIKRVGPWLDFRIIVATAFGVMGTPETVTSFLLRLPGQKVVDAEYHDLSGEIRALADSGDASGEVEALSDHGLRWDRVTSA